MFRYVADEFNKLFKRSPPDPIATEQRLYYNNNNKNATRSIVFHNNNRHKSTLTSPDLNNNNILDISRIRAVRDQSNRGSFLTSFDTAAEDTGIRKLSGTSLIPVNKNEEAKYFRAYNQNESDFEQLDWFGQFKPSDTVTQHR